MRFIIRTGLLAVILLLLLHMGAAAKVSPAQYGLPAFTDTVAMKGQVNWMMDSFMVHQPQMTKPIVSAYSPLREYTSRSADFYMLLFLCLVLGLIRFSDPRYFIMLWKAFWNPTLSNRQLKEQLQGAGIQNVLMNLFFTMSAGAYIYYIVRLFAPHHHMSSIPASLLLLMMVGGMIVIYVGKYLAVQFSGWAFNVESITEHYIFNVFLINKILAVVLIPFVILLAFADPIWAGPLVVVSLVAVVILLVNRYIRSWQVFGSFFQFSKFHFFTYLCASELLPLAVLMKLVMKGMLF